ncbi:MAG: ATP-binding protein [Mycobacteriales bacterium]
MCSVLFVDLVGFTPLAQSRDPEEVRELLSRYFELARTVIGRYGGVVEKFIGDAVMAVWGAPVASEGDAERAVRAGLDLVEAVGTLGTANGAIGLMARAGVVSGEVAVTIGATGEGMVAGDAVNTAARVQATAPPGSVLVDATTRRIAGAGIEFADTGEHRLKGKAAAARLWRATRVLAGVGGTQRVDGLEAPLIGRETELRLVKDLFHASADRRSPRLLVVAGGAGIGKSRIGWEFEKYVDGLASLVWWHRGRCLSYGDGVAFWALAEMVRQRFSIAEEDPTEVAAGKLAAGLADLVADPAERGYAAVRLGRLLGIPVEDDPGAPLAREELFAGWRLFFERLADTAPVVLLVEDAQHADAGLLDFLDHLIDWTRDRQLFVLVLTRPELEQHRPGFGVGRNRTAITLDPLDPQSMDRLVDSLVPGMPESARKRITAHAQGVPLFAVETVRSLIDRDVVLPVEGSYRLVGEVGELNVPDSLHGLLAARLDALDPSVRALAADAAVLGSSFPAEALVAVADQDEASVRAGLADLLRREVLEVSADRLSPQRGAYRFAQQLLRQVAYETLSRRDRKARHLKVAAHLRNTFPDDGEEAVDVIAQHYRDALAAVPNDPDAEGIRVEAMSMSARAGDRALRAGAPATAAGAFATTAELAESAGELKAAASWWERAAEAARLAGDYSLAVTQAGLAIQHYREVGDLRGVARAQTTVGASLRRIGRHTEGRDQLTAALSVLRTEPDRDTVVALNELANLEAFAGGAEADRLSVEALELGQALDVGGALLAGLFVVKAIVHASASRHAQAAASLREAVRLAEQAGDSAMQGRALLNLAEVLAGFDPRAAIAAATDAVELCRRVGARDMLGFAVGNLASVQMVTGQWEAADELLTAAVDRDGLDAQELLQTLRGELAALRGDTATVGEILANLPQLRASEDPQDQASLALLEACAAATAEDWAAALRHATRVVEHADTLGLRHELMHRGWPLAVRAAQARGDLATLQRLLDRLDAEPVGHLPPILRAQRELVRAWSSAEGDRLTASRRFQNAIAAFRRIPAPLHLGQALIDYAEHLGSEDEQAAQAAIREAQEIAEALGSRPLAGRAAAVAANA